MSRRVRAALPLRRIGVVALAMMLLLAGAAGAEEEPREKDRAQYTVDEVMHKKLTDAIEFLGNEQYDEALEILLPLAEKARRLKEYPRALVYQMLGYVYSSQGNYPEALVYFEKCLAEDALPPGAQLSTRFNTAQLYLATEKYEDAARSLEIWFEQAESPTPDAYYLLAAAYYQMQEPQKALPPAEKAVALSKKPKEAWLTLETGLYFELEMYAKAVAPLEQLVSLYGKKSHWTQLSALYAHLEMEEKSLATLQLAYEQELLDKDHELVALAKLYLHHDLPYRAARVLEKGMEDEFVEKTEKNYELLANSWLMAKELDRSLEPMTRAAELSEKGDLFMRLAQVRVQREQWREASQALLRALDKGNLSDESGANLLLGICFYNQKLLDRARSYFLAARSDDDTRKAADQWIDLMEREIQQAKQIEETESATARQAPNDGSSES